MSDRIMHNSEYIKAVARYVTDLGLDADWLYENTEEIGYEMETSK